MFLLILLACPAPGDDTSGDDTHTTGALLGFTAVGAYTEDVDGMISCAAQTQLSGVRQPTGCAECTWLFDVTGSFSSEAPTGCADPLLTLVESPSLTGFQLGYAPSFTSSDGATHVEALVVSFLVGPGDRQWGVLHSDQTEGTSYAESDSGFGWVIHQKGSIPDTGGATSEVREAGINGTWQYGA